MRALTIYLHAGALNRSRAECVRAYCRLHVGRFTPEDALLCAAGTTFEDAQRLALESRGSK